MMKETFSAVIWVIIFIIVGIAIFINIYNPRFEFPILQQGKYDRGGDISGKHWNPLGEKSEEELEKEREKEVEDTIARYKKEFDKDYARILKQDIDEFKKERGLDEFRERFAYDLYEYEVYEEGSIFDSLLK